MIIVWFGDIYNTLLSTKRQTHESQSRIKQLVLYIHAQLSCVWLFLYMYLQQKNGKQL